MSLPFDLPQVSSDLIEKGIGGPGVDLGESQPCRLGGSRAWEPWREW